MHPRFALAGTLLLAATLHLAAQSGATGAADTLSGSSGPHVPASKGVQQSKVAPAAPGTLRKPLTADQQKSVLNEGSRAAQTRARQTAGAPTAPPPAGH